nr:uncharacterized protein LOC116427993 [Nomia melanderi]
MAEEETIDRNPLQKDYLINLNLSLQWNRWILEPFGVWPRSSNISSLRRCFNWLRRVVSILLITFIVVPFAVYSMVEVEDAYNRLKLFGPMSFFLMVYMKFYSLVNSASQFCLCMDQIEWDWKNMKYPKDRDIMVANANLGRRLVKTCVLFTYCGFVFYYVASPIAVGRVTMENITFVPTPFPVARLIADIRYSPANEIFICGQFFSGFVLHGVAIGACSFAAVFAVHACGQVGILIDWLEHLTTGRTDMSASVDERIANVVSQHVRVLKFLSITEEALQQISFVEFIGCTLNLCLLGYYVIREWDTSVAASVTYFIIFISFGFNIFIFCYIGELVSEQCTKVGEVAYMIDWYRLRGKRKHCVILIMAMSNASTKLTAGNMVELSLSTFGDVVKTAVGYMNMLLALT